MKMLSTIVLAVPLVAVTPAFGQGTEAQRAACGPDAFRLCTSAIPDPGRVAACLRRERERLSGACRAMLDEADGASRTAAAPPAPAREAVPPPTRTARIRTERRIFAAPPAPAPAARAPRRASLAASATRTLVSRRGATRTVTRVVYVYVPTKAAPARHAAPRRVASRGGYGSYGGGSQMAQAMYWMRTVSSYAGAMGVDAGSLGGSLGGMNLGGLAGLMQ